MKKYLNVLMIVLTAAALCCLTGQFSEVKAQILSEDLPNREGLEIEDYFILHSALKTEVEFDSNIFLSNTNRKQDTITRLTPSAGIEFPMGENHLSFEYDPTIAFFNRYPEQNYTNHRLRGLLEVFLREIKMTVYDVYKRYTNRAGQDELGAGGMRTRAERNEFEVKMAAEYDQLEYEATYSNRIRRYLGENQKLYGPLDYTDKNYMYNEGDLEIGYKILPKTTILFETVGGHLYYHSRLVPSSWYIEPLLGFKGEWFNKLTFDVRGGVKYQDYGKTDFVRNKDYVDFVARGGVEYTITDDDTISLDYVRTNQDSIYKDMSYYKMDFIGLDYTHRFTDEILASVIGSWQLNRYPHESTEDGVTDKRWDSLWRVGPMVRYDINKWVSLQASYLYGNRTSRFNGFDYDDHVVTLQATAGF